MLFRQIFDDKLAQYAYLIGCKQTKEAVLIDPERDIDRYVSLAEAEGLTITAVAETHIHADFLSGAREFAHLHDVTVYLSDEGGDDWKYAWPDLGEYDVHLLRDGDTFPVGNIEVEAVHTPGHTPEHLTFLVTDCGGGADEPRGLVTGDFVFVGDVGRPDLLESAAGRRDTMKPSARRLFGSVRDRFLPLPDYLQVWPGHGAGSACGKALGSVPDSTVGYEKRFSPALEAAREGEEPFVQYILADQPEPPLYFARMKKQNREGPPLLGSVPTPRPLSASELASVTDRTDAVVIDTRSDRSAFAAGHMPGALHAPLTQLFPTVTGSYMDPEQSIYLIIDESRVDTAVRNLVRIGLDRVEGYATPETLEAYVAAGGALNQTRVIRFDELSPLLDNDKRQVLDVRGVSEYRAGHVPGALNIAHTRLPERRSELPEGKEMVIHCGSGARATAAAALLERYGHEVILVDDAFSRWRALGPVDEERQPQPTA